MDTSALSSYPVYLGVWTNWSQGRVLGSTLTLTRSDGALLIAFVAFFITLIGTHIWRILCFVLHGVLSSNSSQDALHNQRQALLRNSATPLGSIWLIMQMMHAWGRSGHKEARPMRRLAPLLGATLLIAISLAAATGFSSRIAQSNEVLVEGSGCGGLDYRGNASAYNLLGAPYLSRRVAKAADYALRCYESTSPSNECSTFLRPALPMKITSNASCPFESSMCLSQDANVILDSGLMDSHDDLGLNWPEESRFQIQHKRHCAPLVTEGYRTNYTHDGRDFIRYQYSEAIDPLSDCNCSIALSKTWLDDATASRTSPFLEPPGAEINLVSTYAEFLNGTLVTEESSMVPMSELSQHGGDLTLLFLLAHRTLFLGKSDDLWYRASTKLETILAGEGGSQSSDYYSADEPAWPMGCTSQYQVCSDGLCTGLGSALDTLRFMADEMSLSSAFLQSAFYLAFVLPLGSITRGLGYRALSATQKDSPEIQAAPRKDDWHRDVTHWFATIQASLQYHLAEIPTGPDIEGIHGLEDYVVQPPANETERFCHNQKIRSTAFTSFSMFWLLFILVSGMLILLISTTLETIAAVIQKCLSHPQGYARLEWRATHALHLQRLAHKQSGVRDWVQGPWDIPVTTTDTRLAVVEEEEGLPQLLNNTTDDLAHEMVESPGRDPVDDIEAVAITPAPQLNTKDNTAITVNSVSRISSSSGETPSIDPSQQDSQGNQQQEEVHQANVKPHVAAAGDSDVPSC